MMMLLFTSRCRIHDIFVGAVPFARHLDQLVLCYAQNMIALSRVDVNGLMLTTTNRSATRSAITNRSFSRLSQEGPDTVAAIRSVIANLLSNAAFRSPPTHYVASAVGAFSWRTCTHPCQGHAAYHQRVGTIVIAMACRPFDEYSEADLN